MADLLHPQKQNVSVLTVRPGRLPLSTMGDQQMNLARRLALLAALACPVLPGQAFEFAAGGGYGFKDGDDQSRTGVPALGAGLGWPAWSHNKLQLDYLFAAPRNRSFDLHFVTGSYIVRGKQRTVQPFFQAGAGVAMEKVARGVFHIPAGRSSVDAGFALLFGAGGSIDVGKSGFVRPELRSYWFVGPTAVILPMVSAGWRF